LLFGSRSLQARPSVAELTERQTSLFQRGWDRYSTPKHPRKGCLRAGVGWTAMAQASLIGANFALVVKNTFLEFVEEKPKARLRYVRSGDLLEVASHYSGSTSAPTSPRHSIDGEEAHGSSASELMGGISSPEPSPRRSRSRQVPPSPGQSKESTSPVQSRAPLGLQQTSPTLQSVARRSCDSLREEYISSPSHTGSAMPNAHTPPAAVFQANDGFQHNIGSMPIGTSSMPTTPAAYPQVPPPLMCLSTSPKSILAETAYTPASTRASTSTQCLATMPNALNSPQTPKSIDFNDALTTVMLRGLPLSISRQTLMRLLDREGFALCYDFVYLPVDFTSGNGLGYCFVNFCTAKDSHMAFTHFDGFCAWPSGVEGRETTVCTSSWSDPLQGLYPHIERYRSSPVMHPSVPEDWKPIILNGGVQVPFPPPTKHIKAPKQRGAPSSRV